MRKRLTPNNFNFVRAYSSPNNKNTDPFEDMFKLLKCTVEDYRLAVKIFDIPKGKEPTDKQKYLGKIYRHYKEMFPDSFEGDFGSIVKNIREIENIKEEVGSSLNLLQAKIDSNCVKSAWNEVNSSIINKAGTSNVENIDKLKIKCEKLNISDEIIEIFINSLLKSIISALNREDKDEEKSERFRVISASQFIHFFTSNFYYEVEGIPFKKYFRDPEKLYWIKRVKWQGGSTRGAQKPRPGINKYKRDKSFNRKFMGDVFNYLLDISGEYLTASLGHVKMRKYEIKSDKHNIPRSKEQKCWIIDGKDDAEMLQSISRATALLGENSPRVLPPSKYVREESASENACGVNRKGRKICSQRGLSKKVVIGAEYNHTEEYLEKINTLQSSPFSLSIEMLSDVLGIIQHHSPMTVDDFCIENVKYRNRLVKNFMSKLRKQLHISLKLMDDESIKENYEEELVPKSKFLAYNKCEKVDGAFKELDIYTAKKHVKKAIMKTLYNSTAWKLSKDIRNDRKDPYAIWEEELLVKSAALCMNGFREIYPKAYALRNALGTYGEKIYKKEENMIFYFDDQTISYTHKLPEGINICLGVIGEAKSVRVVIKVTNTEITIKKRGRSSTAVNLIHARDAIVLMDSRYELYLYIIYTLGIHDCYLCHPGYIRQVVYSYYTHILKPVDLTKVLPGFKYPKIVLKGGVVNLEKYRPSRYCLMPT